MKIQFFPKAYQKINVLYRFFIKQAVFLADRPVHTICKFIGIKQVGLLFFITACSPFPESAPVSPLEEYEKPSCASENASSSELKRKKRELFQDIEDSNRYKNSKTREQSLQRYKNLIKTKEETDCPQDVIRFIDKVSELHKK